MSEYFRKTFKIAPLPTFEEGQVEIVIHQIQDDTGRARVKPGDPLDVLSRSVVAGLRLTADLGVALDGKLRLGAEEIAKVLREFKTTADAERKVITADLNKAEASLEQIYASAQDKAVESLDRRSEKIADLKIRAALKSTVVKHHILCLVLVVISSLATRYMTQKWDQVAFKQDESALHKAATMYGDDRLELWLKIVQLNDPNWWAACYAGYSGRDKDGRAICEATFYTQPRPPAR